VTSVLVEDDSGLIQSLYAVIGEPPFSNTYSKIRTNSDAVTRSSRAWEVDLALQLLGARRLERIETIRVSFAPYT
jgi:hypothetical protein